MCTEQDKWVDEAALRFAELLVLAIDEKRISNQITENDNEETGKAK